MIRTSSTLLFIILTALLSSGCATQKTLGLIKNHADNIEVRVDRASNKGFWVSLPDFAGDFELPSINSCELTNYYVFGGFSGKALVAVKDDYEDVSRGPNDEQKEDYISQIGECDLVFVEHRECSGTAICRVKTPVRIEAMNSQGNTTFVFSPMKREDVPAGDWYRVVFSAILDVPLAIASIPWLVWQMATI